MTGRPRGAATAMAVVTAEVQLAARKAVPCADGCGRMQFRETMLIRPVGPDGEASDAVLAELRTEAEEWERRPETCGCTAVTA